MPHLLQQNAFAEVVGELLAQKPTRNQVWKLHHKLFTSNLQTISDQSTFNCLFNLISTSSPSVAMPWHSLILQAKPKILLKLFQFLSIQSQIIIGTDTSRLA